jgi:hypothetical protein
MKMKNRVIALIVISALLLSSISLVLSLTSMTFITDWERYINNPILVGSGAYPNIYAPSVLIENSLWKMWYGGWEAGYYPHDRIYRARSNDGLNWIKEGMVLNIGASGTWESDHVNDPSVVKVGAKYYMYYTGASLATQDQIGLATSLDGLNFTKAVGNPILPRVAGTWENWVARPTVIYEDGKFRMWYDARDIDGMCKNIGYAESVDGTNFTRRTTPVLSIRGALKEIANPNVIRLPDGRYLMVMDGWGPLPSLDLYMAISNEGIDWTFYPNNENPEPVLVHGQAGFDTVAITTSHLIIPPASPPEKIWLFFGGSTVPTLDRNTIGVAFAPLPSPPVGGKAFPINIPQLLAPYIGLASTILVATAATTIYVKHVKRRKKKQ